MGGLVGYNRNGLIVASYATGAVKATGTGGWLGGLIGFNQGGTGVASPQTITAKAVDDFNPGVYSFHVFMDHTATGADYTPDPHAGPRRSPSVAGRSFSKKSSQRTSDFVTALAART